MELGLKYTLKPDGTKSVSISDESRMFVVGFVRENATKTPADVAALVQQGHEALEIALADISEVQAAYKPSTNDWSILQLMDHVVTTKQIVVNLCRNLGEGHLPPGVGAEWEEESRQDGVTFATFPTLAEARTACDKAHAELMKLIEGLDSVDTDTRFKHFLFGAFNAREWAVFQRIHDGDHTPQIDAIRATPGFPTA